MVVHAWTYHQGHDFWSPAHYVAGQAGAVGAIAVGVQQMCNGGVAAIEIAAARMIADPAVRRCLVTTADRFAERGFAGWLRDVAVASGDGATAVLLDRAAGPFELVAIATRSAPEFELMHRGDDDFGAMPGWHSDAVDVRRTKEAFVQAGRTADFAAHQSEALRAVLADALADAELEPGDPRLRFVVLPRIGNGVLDRFYRPAIVDVGLGHADVLDPGRDTGHLGAGDTAASLAELTTAGRLGAGEYALLINVGGGFTWSCVVVSAN
jgi:3-oxoacyl-[acyl-carrier-protein] synthase-3